MRFGDLLVCETGKDGGPKSRVDGFWLFRHKRLFTVALLRFSEGSREAFHSHAFNSWSVLLTGGLLEQHLDGTVDTHTAGNVIKTFRNTFHKVYGLADANWVLTFRGPWADTWQEVTEDGEYVTLTHNRVVV